jgi:hypothetical protein
MGEMLTRDVWDPLSLAHGYIVGLSGGVVIYQHGDQACDPYCR